MWLWAGIATWTLLVAAYFVAVRHSRRNVDRPRGSNGRPPKRPDEGSDDVSGFASE